MKTPAQSASSGGASVLASHRENNPVGSRGRSPHPYAMLLVLMFVASVSPAATNDLTSTLQRGLFEEEANRNLDAAAQAYQAVSAQFDKDRALAATAIFRLGEIYRKQNKTNEAAAQYERIVREFADQDTLVTLSRQNLAGLGANKPAASDADRQAATRTGSYSMDASTLAGQLSSLEQMNNDLEKKAHAVFGLFPDNDLKEKMLALEQWQRRQESFEASGSNTNTHRDFASWPGIIANLRSDIKAQVEFIIAAQKARLRVLQAAAAITPARESATGEPSAPTTDDEEKEIRRIQTMIQNSPDLINSPRGGSTPLISAASAGQLRVVTFLLDHNADVNMKSGNLNPLLGAAANGNKAMVELLLSRGADINARDGGGRTALHTAAASGFVSVVETLLQHKADVNTRDSEKNGQQTPLHLAAAAGHGAIVKLLVANGADVNARNWNGGTPLLETAAKGHRDTAAALLDLKADVNAATDEGRTSLHAAAEAGHLEVVTLLLERSASVNVQNNDKATPLLLAVFNQRTDVVKTLLEHKADPDLAGAPRKRQGLSQDQGNYVATPVFYSIKNQDITGILALLLEHGADPDRSQTAGWRPLFDAIQDGKVWAVRLLLAHKADPNKPDREGNAPLLKGIRNVEFVRLLLEAGADPNARDKDGWPAVIQAVNSGSPAILKLLLEHNADVNAIGPSGWTALHAAVGNGMREMVELLLTYKVDVNARMKGGDTPLDLAKRNASRNQPPGIRTIPNRPPAPGAPPLSYPWSKSSSGGPATSEPPSLPDLLRQHGALDDLPDFNSIRVTRVGLAQPVVVFVKDANSVNRFKLIEVVRNFYISPIDYRGLPFPDFSRIVIQRPVAGKPGAKKEVPVNLLTLTNSFDCAKDTWLEFGDVVEIPEREHTLAEQVHGATPAQLTELSHCLEGTVTFVVRGQKAELKLDGTAYTGWLQLALDRVQNLLRSSSDLSHVKIKRTNPVTGKTIEIIADSKVTPNDNVWLRDGDVIEVPDRL